MNMFRESYNADNRLEIVILGAMRGQKSDTSKKIRDAVIEILNENKAIEILAKKGIKGNPIITFPEEWNDQNIEDGVFNKLDTADLIIVNITPKMGKEDPTANVFYELGLIHALGIPYLLVVQEGFKVPFYMRNTRCYRVKNFGIQTIKKSLHDPIYSFIDDNSYSDFTHNVISRFYGGLPIVDISATVGLATGYYMNFVRRILKDDGFISFYPSKIKSLIVVRPPDILSTYQQDHEILERILKDNGLNMLQEKLGAIQTDKDGGIWFDHVNGIVIDIPRTIYPLKKSPRLLSLKERLNHNRGAYSKSMRNSILKQAADKLLDKVEDIIRYHTERDEVTIRTNLLYFSTINQVPELINKIFNEKK